MIHQYTFLMNHLAYKIKNENHMIPEPQEISFNGLFCLTNSQKPKDVEVTMIKKHRNTENSHIWEAGTNYVMWDLRSQLYCTFCWSTNCSSTIFNCRWHNFIFFWCRSCVITKPLCKGTPQLLHSHFSHFSWTPLKQIG